MDANTLAGIAVAQHSVFAAGSEHGSFLVECTTSDVSFLALKRLGMENEDTSA